MFAPFCSLRQARDSEMSFLFKLALLSTSNIHNGVEKSGSVFLILNELILCLGLRAAFWQAVFGTPFNAVINHTCCFDTPIRKIAYQENAKKKTPVG
jgi:hypothetical protein